MHTECMELDLIPHIMMAVEECVPDLKITIHKAIRPPECGHKLNKYYKSMESRYCICTAIDQTHATDDNLRPCGHDWEIGLRSPMANSS